MEDDQWLPLTAAARIAGVSRERLARAATTGRVRSRFVDRRWFIAAADVAGSSLPPAASVQTAPGSQSTDAQ